VRVLHGKLTGDIEEDTTVNGATEGRVVVHPGVRLIINGAATGSLIIARDAVVDISGVSLAVVDNEGTLRINGLDLGAVVGSGAQLTQSEDMEIKVSFSEPHPRAAGAAREDGVLPSGYRVEQDLHLNGVIQGPATVVRGAFLQLDGTVAGDLTVEADALARINGVVGGDVLNRGDVEIYGVVSGRVFDDGGRSFVDENAVVDR
jgi:hypothetical protein